MSILVKKPEVIETGFPIGVVLNKKETKGDIGIEIEVEGKNLPKEGEAYKYWTYHIDHSLRGAENAEYVLSSPIKFDKVPDALDDLWERFAAKGSKIDDSNRTSVHVHLNVQKFQLNRLTSFMALYFALEEVLTEWCGDHRVGNLFCLRAKDAPAIISQIRRFIKADGKYDLRDNLHYAGLNAHALSKFGSIEIRTLRGVAEKGVINDWCAILRRLYELSEEYQDPREICQEFSAMGPIGFFEKLLGSMTATVRAGVPWSDEQITDSMFTGIRLAQDLCYCRDWGVFKGIDMKPDPFGRKATTVASKLQNMFNPGHWDSPVPKNIKTISSYFDPFAPSQQAPSVGHQGVVQINPADFEVVDFEEEFGN